MIRYKDTEILEYYSYNGQNYVQDDNKQVLLCVGLDSYDNSLVDSYRNDELADCIVLLVLDKTDKTVLPIQINRDTMTSFHVLGIGGRITNDEVGQIALSHSYGTGGIDSLVNVKDAVSKLMCDVDIDFYMSLTMDAVAKINDKAGGVTVMVEDDFSSIDPTIIQGQENTLLDYTLLDAVQLQGEAKKGETYVEFYLDETYLKELCINNLYKPAR